MSDTTHDRASEAARRLIAGAFRRDGERLEDDRHPRFSIPTRIDHDDDTVIVAYIDQQREKDATITTLRARLAELEGALGALVTLNDEHSPFGGELYRDRIERTWDRARAALRAKGGE